MVRLQINVNDRQGKPVPCRVHLANAKGEPVKAAGLPFFRDHFTCEGRVVLNLQPGKYTYAVERGPEAERHPHAQGGRTTNAQTIHRPHCPPAQGWLV